MRKIKEVLRLHAEGRLSGRAIARALGISPSTVIDYLGRARVANINWPLPPELDDDAVEQLFYPSVADLPTERVMPDWPYIHQELRRPGVTLLLLWEEYKALRPDNGYQYSRFCELYRDWARLIDVTMRQHHKAGEKLFVDYAGDRLYVTDPQTGQKCPTQLFVAVLGASNFTYAEASWTQSALDWAGAHVRAFEYFGGVPTLVVPDNLKSGVSRACRYDPDINPTYHEMARYYGTAILPARVRKPRDKAKVEAGVQLVQRWIGAVLRNQTFFSLPELNAAVRVLLDKLNDRPFKKLDGSRRSVFEALEKPELLPMPATRYELAEWAKARVNQDYHIEMQGHHYSVPHTLARQQVEVRFTLAIVEILYQSRRVASHPRSFERDKHTTLREHMPAGHLEYMEWTPERLAAWAAKKGECVSRMARAIMEEADHPALGFKASLGLLRLEKLFGADRLEAACLRALHFGTHSYTSVSRILSRDLDLRPLPPRESTPSAAIAAHENVRGGAYFASEVPHA
jgi:transposase